MPDEQTQSFIDSLTWTSSDPADAPNDAWRFIELACLAYDDDPVERREQAAALLRDQPAISSFDIYAAATVGNTTAVKQFLDEDAALVNERGGPRNWEPLLYVAFSRHADDDSAHNLLQTAELLLERGADPNAGFLWRGFPSPFTALTGAFGEGEAGPVRQPPHDFSMALARCLLEAGADPNDNQSLYNRLFTGGTEHLTLLFEYGLGKPSDGPWLRQLKGEMYDPKQMLNEQVWWAVKHDMFDRVQLLVEQGVDVNCADNRDKRAPLEIALLSGNTRIADYLVEHGAKPANLNEEEQFIAACLAANEAEAKRMRDAVSLPSEEFQADVLCRAASMNRTDAVTLMLDLGFNVNAISRTTALHQAAWNGKVDMINFLLARGADPSIRDKEHGGTPLDWAKHNHQHEAAAALEPVSN